MRALVYSATPENPNFVRPTSVDAAAATVAAAVGPSGPNPEYVFALERWLREVGEEDAHVFELAEAVIENPPMLIRDGGVIAEGYSAELDELFVKSWK